MLINSKFDNFVYTSLIPLKFCLVAEGKADVYPRLGPTMEWDTAAGHALVLEAGARVKVYGQEMDLQYNKENLLNPFFIVEKAN